MVSKPIVWTAHALGYVARRGFSVDEVEEAIRSELWTSANQGRWECRRNFVFHGEWNGKSYATKQVRPVFVDEPLQIVVITVYTYFF